MTLDTPRQRVERAEATFVLPASSAQRRLWIIDRLQAGGTPTYNASRLLRIEGRLDPDLLEYSIGEVVRRHESLRTRFAEEGGRVVQRIAAEQETPLARVDLGGLSGRPARRQARALIRDAVRQPFDLGAGPLLRTVLYRFNADDHLLLLVLHHIVTDGWSMEVLRQDLFGIYEAAELGRPAPLPPLPIQYADYAVWEQERLQAGKMADHLSYWLEKLGDHPPAIELPTDYPRPPRQTFSGAIHAFDVDAPTVAALRSLGRRENATLFMTLLAVFNVLLHRYTGQVDLPVGIPVANRLRAELEPLIGVFVNTLVLRSDLSADPGFGEVLRRIRRVAVEAYAHAELPFEKLVESLRPRRDPGRHPLFQIAFNMQPAAAPSSRFGPLSVTVLPAEHESAKFDLSLNLTPRGDELRGQWVYNTDLFDKARIERMSGHFDTLLRAIVQDPELPVAALPLLSAAERRLLLVEWNDAGRDYDRDVRVHESFEQLAARAPDAVALVHEDAELSYAELNSRANALAHHLRASGVQVGARVGLFVDRSPEMVVGILGILKSGSTYVPLDPGHPAQRTAFMLADAGIRMVLTQRHLRDRLPEVGCRVVCLDRDREAIQARSSANPDHRPPADGVAYVIYTSGSTGQPKGVMVSHAAIGANCQVMQRCYRMGSGDRVLQFSRLSFDQSLDQILLPLNCGAAIVLSGEELLDPVRLTGTLRRYGVSFMNLAPVYWRHWIQILDGHDRAPDLPALRLISLGGEAIPPDSVRIWNRLGISRTVRLLNAYGPTEATITTTVHEVAGDVESETVPIGRPLPGRSVFILDAGGRPVPVGVAGELHIGGDFLALGYLNRPELTAERFIPDPFSTEIGARLYRTGDLARYRSDGVIEFLGRLDHQVKLRGFRVELGEIESVLARHPAVERAVVVLHLASGGEPMLVAWVTASGVDTAALRRFAERSLPDYMLPSRWVLTRELPLTASGKVDRAALAARDPGAADAEGPEPPATPVEAMLASVWESLLGCRNVGRRSDFFVLGGHSLLAMQMVSRIWDRVGVDLPLRSVFEHPLLSELAARIEESIGETGRRSADTAQPLPSATQRRRTGAGAGGPAAVARLRAPRPR